MKTALAALAFLAASIQFTAAQGVPFVSAVTLSSGKRDVNSVAANGFNQTQAVRSIGVGVDWRFTGQQKESYEVQCFFVAKNESGKGRYIYDAVRIESKNASGKAEFRAEPLMGSGKQWYDIPFVGTVDVTTRTDTRDATGNTISSSSSTSPETVRGTLRLTNEIVGSKVEGWIVRVVSGGKPVKVLSNQSHLEPLARGISDTLDAVAAKARKQ